MSIVENSANAKNYEANMAQDFWPCVVTCHYDATLHSKCMIVSEADSNWSFDSGGGLHVNFVDDKWKVHHFSNCDVIVMSGTLCNGLYRLDTYKRAASNAFMAHTSSLTKMELWHARFGHLNFNSLRYLQKEMVIGLAPIESIEKHAYEGCILGKMHRATFPKDNHTHYKKIVACSQ